MTSGNTVDQLPLNRLASDAGGPWPSERMSRPRRRRSLLALLPLLLVVGCATVSHNTVPKDLISEATVLDMPNLRAWGDEYSPALQRSLVESVRQARAINPRGVVDATGAASVLALSGGGANGAFGAGLLKGWTESGTRPVFKLVTGISTGALIAPFAFLGSGYDATSPAARPQWSGGASAAPQDAGLDISVTQADRETFQRMLGEVQDAFSHENYGALRELTTPEVMSYLAEELSQNATQGRRNDVSGTRLLSADIAEAWREGDVEYATAAMNYESIDVMRDRGTGRLLEGDPDRPTATTELWTFTRRNGGAWKLSAIQQA